MVDVPGGRPRVPTYFEERGGGGRRRRGQLDPKRACRHRVGEGDDVARLVIVGACGENGAGLVEHAVALDAEGHLAFGVTHEYRFHRMIVVGIEHQLNALDCLRLGPAERERRLGIGEVGDPGVGRVRWPGDAVDNIGRAEERER